MKILFLDIETAPSLAYSYQRFNTNISPVQVKDTGFILCYQWAWGDGEIQHESIRHRKPPLNSASDKLLVANLAKLVGEADVIVGHNAIKFDLGILNARLATHGMKPPPPALVVDTLRACRRFFRFSANSLDAVCQELGLGRKFSSGGYETTLACMQGDQAAWDKLLEYGDHDVRLLRDLYHRIKPWISNHPNQNLFHPKTETVCHVCSSKRLQWRGTQKTLTQEYYRYQCQECGAWGRERKTMLEKEKREVVTRGI